MSFRLTILYTGGTLGMRQSAQGLVPAPDLAQRFKAVLAKSTFYHKRIQAIEWTVMENQPLLDSANIRPQDWEAISKQCQQLSDTDAIVIVHGTDTLAYSASALAFLLQDIKIPVVLTGAQKPMGFFPGDALDNLAGAMLAVQNIDYGVWVYFHRQMLPAARVVKKDAISFTGFEAPRLRADERHNPATSIGWQAQPRDWNSVHVASAHMVPGYRADNLLALLNCHPSAIILALYGGGTLAEHNQDLIDAIEQAQINGIIVVAVSQCYIGDINFKIYATGAVLDRLGVVSGRDITLEAAYAKLMVLLRMGYTSDEIRQLFQQNLANELSISNL